jgi:uncharacterized membrane protein
MSDYDQYQQYQTDTTPTKPPPNQQRVRVNRGLLWFSKRWLLIITIILGVYSSFTIITPLMMIVGLEGPARVLYTLYAPFCHQFGFRSFFLGGEQTVYPRAVAGTDLVPFENYVANDPQYLALWASYYERMHGGQPPAAPPTEAELAATFTPWMQFAAKDFFGNEQMGYKTTLCERDVAIYGAMFIGSLIYMHPAVRRRLRPAPLYLYFILGILPIAIDGLSQLLSYPPFELWLPRETLPSFRVLTGALFGLMNVWLAFPYINVSMMETRMNIETKLRNAGLEP